MALMNKQNAVQNITNLIQELVQRTHTHLETLEDPTRQFEYGVEVHVGVFSNVNGSLIRDMSRWCKQSLGSRWQYSNKVFWFGHARDRTLFLLRWSECT